MAPRRRNKGGASKAGTATGTTQMELPGISELPRGRKLKAPVSINGFARTVTPAEPGGKGAVEERRSGPPEPAG